ncbi:AtuA-related protein [Pseudoteredinibacter isoporae]|uniref:AtuA-related protein n=1 Tax=Pseudoteredinibacter isoporae TaxID=570281 RepID=UPI003EBECCB5
MNGECVEVKPAVHDRSVSAEQTTDRKDPEPRAWGPLVEVELGEVFGTRSGDKGGVANLGVWAKTDLAFEYLRGYLTEARLQALLPDTQGLNVTRYEFTGVRALNFCIHGYLKNGADSSGRLDSLAKAVGQYSAGKCIQVPKSLLD